MNLLKNCIFILSNIIFFTCYEVLEAALQQQYRVIDIGTLESDESVAYAVNDFDEIVGTYKLHGNSHVFFWNQKEGVSLLDLPGSSIPKVFNNKKQIAGQYKENGFQRGFFYDPVSGFCDIGSLGGSNTWVMDMNAKGQIVGYSETGKLSPLRSGFREIHAFIWHEGVMNDLGVLIGDIGLGGDESVASGISDRGDIIGHSNFALVHKGKMLSSTYKAVIWKHRIAEELFPEILQSPFLSKALSISRNGKIVVVREIRSNFYEYVVFDQFNKNIKCFMNSSGLDNNIIKVNDNGALIKGFAILSYSGTAHAQGPSDPFWEKYDVLNGINNSNKIVGKAKSIYGESHAVLIIPE